MHLPYRFCTTGRDLEALSSFPTVGVLRSFIWLCDMLLAHAYHMHVACFVLESGVHTYRSSFPSFFFQATQQKSTACESNKWTLYRSACTSGWPVLAQEEAQVRVGLARHVLCYAGSVHFQIFNAPKICTKVTCSRLQALTVHTVATGANCNQLQPQSVAHLCSHLKQGKQAWRPYLLDAGGSSRRALRVLCHACTSLLVHHACH
jgi:hypothetical protein